MASLQEQTSHSELPQPVFLMSVAFLHNKISSDLILQPHTRVCVPVPLYHCFGSVGAGIVMAVHGTTIVFPSAGYDGKANIAAVESER